MKPETKLAAIATAGILLLACLSQCSCTLTVYPDGRREYKADPEMTTTVAQAAQIIALGL